MLSAFYKKFLSGITVLVLLNIMPLRSTCVCQAGIHLKKKINAAINKPVPQNAPTNMEPVFISAVPDVVPEEDARQQSPFEERPLPPPAPGPANKNPSKNPTSASPAEINLPDREKHPVITAEVSAPLPEITPPSPSQSVIPLEAKKGEPSSEKYPKKPLPQKTKKTAAPAAGASILFWLVPALAALGGLIFFFSRRNKKNTIFIMFRNGRQLICSRWRHGKDNELNCEKLQPFAWRKDTKNLFREALNRSGYEPSMVLTPLLASEQVATFLFTLPLLRKAKIKKAVEEKLREEKIPYDSREDKLQISVLEQNKKDKKTTVLTTLFKERDFELEWGDLEIKPDRIISITAGLAAGLPREILRQATGIIAYQRNEEELLVLNTANDHLDSRRLYQRTAAPPPSSGNQSAPWRSHLETLEQILELYYRRRQQLISTVYLGGKDLPLGLDVHEEIAKRLRCTVKIIGPRPHDVPCQEILQGAARLVQL